MDGTGGVRVNVGVSKEQEGRLTGSDMEFPDSC